MLKVLLIFGFQLLIIYLPFRLYILKNSKQMETNCLRGKLMGFEIVTDVQYCETYILPLPKRSEWIIAI